MSLARHYPTVQRSGLFDAEYYLAQYPDVKQSGVDPLRHYLLHGGFEGRNPSQWFLSDFYLAENQDVYRHRVNPLLHYIQRGDKEGRRPNPFFDPTWYRGHNPFPDSASGTTLHHYLNEGRAKDVQTCDPTELQDVLKIGGAPPHSKDTLSSALEAWKDGMPYSKWIARFDTLSPDKRLALSQERSGSTDLVTFFIIIFPTSRDWDSLTASIRSLHAQIHTNWRALIISDVPLDQVSTDTALVDPRCHIITWEEARSKVCESARSTRGRSFCGVLQPGEILREHSLLLAARSIEQKPNVALVYSDEDTLLSNGRRASPICKPDWDPLLFSHIDYIGSSAMLDARRFPLRVTRDTVKAPPSIANMCEFNATDLERENVAHLSSILLHTTEETSYATRLASRPSIHLHESTSRAITHYDRNKEQVADTQPLVSIVIPTKKNRALLEVCVTSILEKTTYPNFEILIIDNDANKDTKTFLETLRDHPRCRILLQPGPFNYSALNNAAIDDSRGDLICLLNDDVEVGCGEWLDALVSFAKQPGVGAVGSRLLYPDGSIQHGGVVVGGLGLAAHSFVGVASPEQSYMGLAAFPREVSAITAACLLIEKNKYLSVGGLDAQHLKVNFNDVDLCLKLRTRGLSNIVLPLPGMIHHESKSRGHSTASPESQKQLKQEAEIMHTRWGERLRVDPHYNRNLSLAPTLYQLSTTLEPDSSAQSATYPINGEYTALGREPRLDIYGDESNEARAARASRPGQSAPHLSTLSPGLSVAILNKDAPDLIVPLVEQLAQQQKAFERAGLGFEILIGDTGSTNPKTLELYRNLPPFAKLVRGMRYNFSSCNNELESQAAWDTVLFLNNDIIFPSDTNLLLTGFKRLHTDTQVGILGGVLLYPNGRIQHMGCEFLHKASVWGLPYHVHVGESPDSVRIPEQATYPSVTGAFLMISRSLFTLCGGFDPIYKAECQDIALCLEAHRRGFSATCVNLGPIIHIENATRPKGEENFADRRRFLRKFGAYIQGAFS